MEMSRRLVKIEPPVIWSQWSSITNMEKKIEEEVVCYRLDGQSSGIKKKIQVVIGEDQEDDLAEAVGKVYSDTILVVDALEAAQLSEDNEKYEKQNAPSTLLNGLPV